MDAILPMQLQVGDRFTDEEGDWEVTGRPYTTREGEVVHVTIQRTSSGSPVRASAPSTPKSNSPPAAAAGATEARRNQRQPTCTGSGHVATLAPYG